MTRDIWHVTRDTWHVTRDIWHVTHDTWHITCDMWCAVNIPAKCQFPRSCGLGDTVSWRYFHKGWLSLLKNHRGVCRTAPTTPGLLNMLLHMFSEGTHSKCALPPQLQFPWVCCMSSTIFRTCSNYCLRVRPSLFSYSTLDWKATGIKPAKGWGQKNEAAWNFELL